MNNVKNNKIIRTVFAVLAIGFCFSGILMPSLTNADYANNSNSLFIAKTAAYSTPKVVKTISVVVTAYTSDVAETDDTPFITASGECVADGIVANNGLAFGTKIRIPALYGNKVFVVEDRMAKRKGNYHVDIWMQSKDLAINFGAKMAQIEVLTD